MIDDYAEGVAEIFGVAEVGCCWCGNARGAGVDGDADAWLRGFGVRRVEGQGN